MSKTQRVESLIYKLNPTEGTVYKDPPPLEVDQEKWKGRLENGVLTCHMKADYDSVSDARTEIEGYLRAWEVNANLKHGKGSIKFVYQDANVVDLTPQRTGRGLVICGKAVAMGIGTMTASVQIISKNYPPPPKDFTVSPDVETIWSRYVGYLDGKEPLLDMANFCLTVVDESYGQGSRKAAARALNVDTQVLIKLGHLTSTRGDNKTARKAPKGLKWQPLSGKEPTWVDAVVRRLIRRAGEYAACGDSSALPKIGMSDFPPLE